MKIDLVLPAIQAQVPGCTHAICDGELYTVEDLAIKVREWVADAKLNNFEAAVSDYLSDVVFLKRYYATIWFIHTGLHQHRQLGIKRYKELSGDAMQSITGVTIAGRRIELSVWVGAFDLYADFVSFNGDVLDTLDYSKLNAFLETTDGVPVENEIAAEVAFDWLFSDRVDVTQSGGRSYYQLYQVWEKEVAIDVLDENGDAAYVCELFENTREGEILQNFFTAAKSAIERYKNEMKKRGA